MIGIRLLRDCPVLCGNKGCVFTRSRLFAFCRLLDRPAMLYFVFNAGVIAVVVAHDLTQGIFVAQVSSIGSQRIPPFHLSEILCCQACNSDCWEVAYSILLCPNCCCILRSAGAILSAIAIERQLHNRGVPPAAGGGNWYSRQQRS